jgi:hypothetical protein
VSKQEPANWFELLGEVNVRRKTALDAIQNLIDGIDRLHQDPSLTENERRKVERTRERWAKLLEDAKAV